MRDVRPATKSEERPSMISEGRQKKGIKERKLKRSAISLERIGWGKEGVIKFARIRIRRVLRF